MHRDIAPGNYSTTAKSMSEVQPLRNNHSGGTILLKALSDFGK